MIKLISFIVPSYNSEAYLNRCIDTLLFDLDKIEIIIVNDGSKDRTLKIAKEYKAKYPKTVSVIDKQNGGHGSGVNAGLANATGLYFKVVDSDDWLETDNAKYLLDTIERHAKEGVSPDLYITDFLYNKLDEGKSYRRTYKENFPIEKIIDWNHLIHKFSYSSTLLMHSLVYKTSVLKESNMVLPEHTFYVDNIVSYLPLPHTKSLYYIEKVVYQYYIGREDQSIQRHNIIRRYEQQIRVFKVIMYAYTYQDLQHMPKGLKRYMKHALMDMMIITQMFTTGKYTSQRKTDLKNLWSELKQYDRMMYKFLKYRSYNTIVSFLPFRLKGFIMLQSYLHLTRRINLG